MHNKTGNANIYQDDFNPYVRDYILRERNGTILLDVQNNRNTRPLSTFSHPLPHLSIIKDISCAGIEFHLQSLGIDVAASILARERLTHDSLLPSARPCRASRLATSKVRNVRVEVEYV